MGRPKGSKNKPKVAQGTQANIEPVRANEPVTFDGKVIGKVADLPVELKPQSGDADAIPATRVRVGDKILSFDGTPMKPEWQRVVTMTIVPDMGGMVVIGSVGEVIHKYRLDTQIVVEREE